MCSKLVRTVTYIRISSVPTRPSRDIPNVDWDVNPVCSMIRVASAASPQAKISKTLAGTHSMQCHSH